MNGRDRNLCLEKPATSVGTRGGKFRRAVVRASPLLAACIGLSLQAGPPIQLEGPSSYSHTNVDGVIAGDFNRDSRVDLATISSAPTVPGVAIWLNHGISAFALHTNYAPPGTPRAFTSGDFNGDGKVDLLTANTSPTGDSLTCLLGDGTGGFEPRSTSVSINASVPGIAAADFDGDGKLDVVLATYGIRVLRGLGNGYFTLFTNYDAGIRYAAAVADLNGDGKMDVVTGNYSSSSMSVYLGNGDGTFAPPTDYSGDFSEYHYAVVVGDYNGDGHPDLATVNQYGSSVSVRLNQGNGTFGPETRFRASLLPHSLATADLNGDGFLDLVTAGSSAGSTSALGILPGNGDGTFGTALTNFSGFSGLLANQSVALGDFDGDGRPDLASTRTADKTLSIRINLTRPAIQMERVGQSVKLTWPDWSAFSLQTSDDLTQPSHWIAETNQPSVLGGQKVLTNSIQVEPRFFRLKKL